jgi:hypothetical protein
MGKDGLFMGFFLRGLDNGWRERRFLEILAHRGVDYLISWKKIKRPKAFCLPSLN